MITGNAPRYFLTLSYMPCENIVILQQIDSIDTLVRYMPSLLDSTQLIFLPLITTLRFGTPQLCIPPPPPNTDRILSYISTGVDSLSMLIFKARTPFYHCHIHLQPDLLISSLSIDLYWLKHCSLSSERLLPYL